MKLAEPERPVSLEPDAGDRAEALFQEARRRRRRLRIVAASATALVIAALAVGISRTGDTSPATTTRPRSSGGIAPTPGHLTSVVFTESEIEGGAPDLRVVFATTLGTDHADSSYRIYQPATPSASIRAPHLQLSRIVTGTHVFEDIGATNRRSYDVCTSSGCLTTSKKWVEWSTTNSTTGAAEPGAAVADPSHIFTDLRAVDVSFTRVGTATISGITMTEYRGVVPRESRGAISAAPAAVRAYLSLAFSTGPGAPIDLWVDSRGIVRKALLTFPRSSGPSFTQAQFSWEFSYTELNQPIRTVSPPPTDEVLVLAHGPVLEARAAG